MTVEPDACCDFCFKVCACIAIEWHGAIRLWCGVCDREEMAFIDGPTRETVE